MVNSTSSGKVVDTKMRDEIYLRHLREVEKINNREAEQVNKDIRNYNSINNLHHKHKAYAFDWHHKEENNQIHQKNHKLSKKIKEIKSYINYQPVNKLNFSSLNKNSQPLSTNPERTH